MQTPIRNIGLLILLVIVLPVVIFSVFEIGNMRQNERVIQDIYRNQLDALLFSINQYSDDMMGNFASRIEIGANSNETIASPELEKLISEIPSANSLMMFDGNFEFLSSVPFSYRDSALLSKIQKELYKNEPTLRRLQTYMRSGYRKIETFGETSRDMQWIVFLTHIRDREVINVLNINPELFISRLLDPKIQEITRGKFYITAYYAGDDVPFYASNKQHPDLRTLEKRPFWLLKDYVMGIELEGITIADLARERINRNLILIGLMDIILLFGAWLIYRNITRQLELSQLKNGFVANVSHEIRTPLALISMYIETLEMGRVKEAQKVSEYYKVILNETARLSGIVNRILSFSQIESNKRKYIFGNADLNEIVENAFLTFRYTIENKGFHYSFEPDKSLPEIEADRDAVADAFVNLLDNAMKYSTDNKNIAVRTGLSGSFVFIEVEDQGIGISEKNQKYIFDKFYRVTEENLANRVKGSGLGLSIVKHIMDAHEGKIYLKSSPGSGSLFRLMFPAKNTKQA
jgi:two-component system, OmpR family, phosphate regulon sensor histidine kinase PhoR